MKALVQICETKIQVVKESLLGLSHYYTHSVCSIRHSGAVMICFITGRVVTTKLFVYFVMCSSCTKMARALSTELLLKSLRTNRQMNIGIVLKLNDNQL